GRTAPLGPRISALIFASVILSLSIYLVQKYRPSRPMAYATLEHNPVKQKICSRAKPLRLHERSYSRFRCGEGPIERQAHGGRLTLRAESETIQPGGHAPFA